MHSERQAATATEERGGQFYQLRKNTAKQRCWLGWQLASRGQLLRHSVLSNPVSVALVTGMMPSVVAFLCFQGLLGVVRSAQPSFSPQVRVAFADFDACDTNTTARPCYMRSLHENLLPWARAGDSGGVTRQHIEAMRSVRDAQRLTFYKIVDGRLYRNNSQFEGLSPDWKGCFIGPRCEGIEHFLTTLLQRGASKLYRQLPDVEFFVNVRDTPTSPRHTRKTPELDSPLPIFSFSVADDGRFADIMFVTRFPLPNDSPAPKAWCFCG